MRINDTPNRLPTLNTMSTAWRCPPALLMLPALWGGALAGTPALAAHQVRGSAGVLECTALVVKDPNGVQRARIETSPEGVSLSLFDRENARIHLEVVDGRGVAAYLNRADGQPAIVGSIYDDDHHGATVDLYVLHPETNQPALEYTYGGMGQEVFGKLSLYDDEGRTYIGLSAGGGSGPGTWVTPVSGHMGDTRR